MAKSDQTTTTLHSKVPYKQDVRLPQTANVKYGVTQDQLRTASLRQTAPASDKYSLNTVNTAQLSAMPASSSPQLHARPQGVIAAQMQQQQQVGSVKNLPQSKTSSSSHISQPKIASTLSIAPTSQNMSGQNVASISSQRSDVNTALSNQSNITGNQMTIKATIGDQTFNSASLSSPLNPDSGSVAQPVLTKTNTTAVPYGTIGKSSDNSGKKAVTASIGSETNQILPSILRGEIVKPLADTSSTSAILSESTPNANKPVVSTEGSSENKTSLSVDVNLKESNESDSLKKTSESDSKAVMHLPSEKDIGDEEKQTMSLETETVASIGSESGKDLPGDASLKSDDIIPEEAMDVDLDTTEKDDEVEQERMDEEVKSSNNDEDEHDGNDDKDDGLPLDTLDDNAGVMENEPW